MEALAIRQTTDAPRLFLDVRRSANGCAWEHRLGERQENIALAMAQSHGLPEIVARVLAGRGVGIDEAPRFLDPTIRDLMPDPLTMTDMDKAGERIARAIMKRERIAIFGDYDVDGACSSALLKRFLDHFGVKRAFVAKGILAARHMANAGMATLSRSARIGEPLSTFHFGFLLGPRINAGGRIGDAALGSRLLSMDDPVEAAKIAETLERLNSERQAMEQAMLAEARAEADAELAGGRGPAVLVTGSDKWHPGVVGLLASRLKDHARRPAFAIAFNSSGVGTGSGRSITGFDMGRMVRDAVNEGLLVKGGGHAMAAGITMERARLGDLRAFFEERAAETVFALRDADSIRIDAAVSAEGANLALVDTLEKAGPYGAGHPQPVLALPRHRIADLREVGTGHLRVHVVEERLLGIAV